VQSGRKSYFGDERSKLTNGNRIQNEKYCVRGTFSMWAYTLCHRFDTAFPYELLWSFLWFVTIVESAD
jgi:hypothetical protein